MSDDRWRGMALEYNRRLMEATKYQGALEQEVASLKEQIALIATEDDRPLWRRIANQRLAIRWEIHYRELYYRLYRREAAEVVRLKKELEGKA